MRAFYLPCAVLCLIFVLSLQAGTYVAESTDQYLSALEHAQSAAKNGFWGEAQRTLHTAYRDWTHHRSIFHLILEHQELDETEKLFSGALAACGRQDEAELSIHLMQLSAQLSFLAETQALSIENIL